MTLRQDQQQPLTRRQLRELEKAQQQQNAEGAQQVPPVKLPFSSDPVPAPAELRPALSDDAPKPPAPQAEAPAAPVVPLTRRQLRALQQAAEGQQVPVAEVPHAAEAPAPTASAPTAEPIADVPVSALPLPQPAVPVAPPVIAVAPATEEVTPEVSEPEVIADAPQGPVTGQVRAFQPPTGHWSLAASDDADDTSSTGSSSATNALIMPIVPSAADVTGPLNATGEILLTGSIDLPRGLGATGQVHGRFDGNDIDHALDQRDRDARPDSGVEPVAATRAISTHAVSVSPTIVPPKKTSHKVGAIVGSVAAGVAALGVAGVLVAGIVFHAF